MSIASIRRVAELATKAQNPMAFLASEQKIKGPRPTNRVALPCHTRIPLLPLVVVPPSDRRALLEPGEAQPLDFKVLHPAVPDELCHDPPYRRGELEAVPTETGSDVEAL